MRTSLAWRISRAYLVLIGAVLLVLGLYLVSFTRSVHLAQLEAQLAAEAAIAAGEAAQVLVGSSAHSSPGATASLQALATRVGASSGTRITLIAPDGVVLADSAESPLGMENHASRPEVAAALRGGRGTISRRSTTVDYDMLYVAVPISVDGRVLGAARTALPLAAFDHAESALVAAVALAIAFAALAAGALAVWLGRTTTEPIHRLTGLAGAMADGRLDSRLRVTSDDEVGRLGLAFNRMADRLQETFGTISAERNRLAAVLETIADGLVIVDPAGRVLLLNPAAERLLRVTADRAVGQPFISVARDHELAALLSHPNESSRLIALGSPRRQVRALAAEIPDADGQRLLLLQDVTELRRLETIRRDFVANVSHELRTPISAIKAIVETLEDGALEDPPAAREFLSRMHDEVDSLAQMVRELLELSRIESGQATLHPMPTDLEPLLRTAAERLMPLVQRAGVELKVEVPRDLPPALVDPDRMNQVLANLLHNAVKFTPPNGSIELNAVLRTSDSRLQPPKLQISVADTGIGIPPDDLDRVFERFYKTDRSRSSGGTGLGLAIAKHLVQAHGGRIWAESKGSSGTIFSFTVPLATADSGAELAGAAWQRS